MKPLAIAVGDPAGIGPEVARKAMQSSAFAGESFVVFGDPQDFADLPRVEVRGTEVSDPIRNAHRATAESGAIQLGWLDAAIDAVQAGACRGLVTGPTCKEAIVASGTPFTGQTERLAERTGVAHDDVTMLFLGPKLRVALVTTHMSVVQAAEAIDVARVRRTIAHLTAALAALGIGEPKIWVTGVNPHAGEHGLFGTEEVAVVTPAVRGTDAVGPVPAEAAFRAAADGRIDGVVAMLHDQATIASKLLDWGHAVNVTWGLPIVRTSVDHGVGFDIAGQGRASAEGMEAAIRLAVQLTAHA